ncbi:hypothetical protein KY339_05190 [Candidatus Woesearchaeota archaeon]|nr:hypothetical protein [Candidatus Woesearchaeota archaeon]
MEDLVQRTKDGFFRRFGRGTKKVARYIARPLFYGVLIASVSFSAGALGYLCMNEREKTVYKKEEVTELRVDSNGVVHMHRHMIEDKYMKQQDLAKLMGKRPAKQEYTSIDDSL